MLAIKSFIFSRVKITTVEPIKRTTPTRRPVIKVPKVNKTFIKWPPLFNGRLPQKLVSSFKLSIYQVFFRFQGLKELLNFFPLVRSLSRASSAQAFKVSKPPKGRYSLACWNAINSSHLFAVFLLLNTLRAILRITRRLSWFLY